MMSIAYDVRLLGMVLVLRPVST